MHDHVERIPASSVDDATPLSRVADLVVNRARVRPADLARAAVCLKHHVGCALHGLDLPWSRAALDLAAGSPCPGSSGRAPSTVPPSTAELAVFANAVLGQSTLAEDVHIASPVHPGSIVIPPPSPPPSGSMPTPPSC